MSSSQRGNPAAMPAPGYSRPAQVNESGLVVTHVTEDGSSVSTFDFTTVDCPPDLLRSLVQGFAVATGQAGRWKSAVSADAGAGILRRFVRDICEQDNAPTRIEELGPEVWWAFRAAIESKNRWPGVINQTRVLLADTPGLPDLTRRALRAKTRKPKNRLYVAYSRAEFRRIRIAASQMVRRGQARIDFNLNTLAIYRAGDEPADAPTVRIHGDEWTAGRLLDHMARTGSPPPGASGTGRSGESRSLLNLDGASTLNEAIFPNSAEALSIGFLLTCERGYNPSVINDLTITTDRADDHATEDEIHVIHIDKPRRGPSARFSDESLTGNSSKVVRRSIALTEQARETLALLGHSTDSLLLYRTGKGDKSQLAGVFKTTIAQMHTVYPRWHKVAGLTADDGAPLKVTFQRLRLTEQVLNTQPRQNTAAVSESVYRQPDPQTHHEAKATILRGQADALEHAHSTVAMRSLTDSDLVEAARDPQKLGQRLGVSPEKVSLLLSGALNTATGACLDFTHSPFADEPGQRCPASFLACFACPNGVATPAHLPRLVATSDALDRIGSAVTPAVWAEDYAAHYARLTDLLLANTTPEQRDHARREVTDDVEAVIDKLLTRGLDT